MIIKSDKSMIYQRGDGKVEIYPFDKNTQNNFITSTQLHILNTIYDYFLEENIKNGNKKNN